MKTVRIIVDFQGKLRKMSAFHAGHTFSENWTYIYIGQRSMFSLMKVRLYRNVSEN